MKRLLGVRYFKLVRIGDFATHFSFDSSNILIIRPLFENFRFWDIRFALLGFTIDFEYQDWNYSPF